MLFFIIDSEKREVREFHLKGDDLEDTLNAQQEVVGGLIAFAGSLDDTNEVYVNDDLQVTSDQHYFEIEGVTHEAFTGNGVVVGFNADNGETVTSTLTIEEVRAKIKFLSFMEVVEKYG